MSNKNLKSNLFQSKTHYEKNQKKNNKKNTLLSEAYYQISQKIINSINYQRNQIELDFNNFCKSYRTKTLIRNQKSLDNISKIRKKSRKKENLGDKQIIKYIYSLKDIKPRMLKKYNQYPVKNIDIDLINKDNIFTNDFLSIFRNSKINNKRTSNSTKIKSKKTEFTQKSKKNINNNIKIRNINTKRNTSPNSLFKENIFSLRNTHKKIKSQNESKSKIKKQKDKINLDLKFNKSKYKLIKKIERRKLSFDLIENNIEKNKSLESKYVSNYTSFDKKNLINKKKENLKINNKVKEEVDLEYVNNENLISENEQEINNKINEIKINNYIINKPKEENMKFSSLKYNFSDNDEQAEKMSEVSKIIIGQIEAYKDIIEQDKSKSLVELLSKISFSYARNNNKPSIINGDNINSHFFDEIISENKDINNINITNIKNVDEDFDSEDLSSIIKNNIKSINTHSKGYMYKKKINLKYKNNIKTSMNTNNTTISSKEKMNNNNPNHNNIKTSNNEKNTKSNKNKIISSNYSKPISPLKIKNTKKFETSNLNNKKKPEKNEKILNKAKNNAKFMNKNEIRKKIDITKRLNTIKSNANMIKKIDTNSIFNSQKKFKKKLKSKLINDLNYKINKSPLKQIDIVKNTGNFYDKKISNNSLISTVMNGDNETIINECFNEAENEICNNDANNKNANAFNQCFIF